MRKILRFAVVPITLLTILIFSSCHSGKSSVQIAAYSFADSMGNTVTLPEKPQKIAVLFYSFADIWVTAGGKVDITVNISAYKEYGTDVKMQISLDFFFAFLFLGPLLL